MPGAMTMRPCRSAGFATPRKAGIPPSARCTFAAGSARAVVANLRQEARVEIHRIHETEEGALRIGIRDDGVRGDLGAVREHDAVRFAVSNDDARDRCAGADLNVGAAGRIRHRRGEGARAALDDDAAAARARRRSPHSTAAPRRCRRTRAPSRCRTRRARRRRPAEDLSRTTRATRSAAAIGPHRSSRKPSVRPRSRKRLPTFTISHISPVAGSVDRRRRHLEQVRTGNARDAAASRRTPDNASRRSARTRRSLRPSGRCRTKRASARPSG